MPWQSGFCAQGPEGEPQLASQERRKGVLGKKGHLRGTEVKAGSCGWDLEPSTDAGGACGLRWRGSCGPGALGGFCRGEREGPPSFS